MYLGDIFMHNFADFWNNSTKFGEILDMGKIHGDSKLADPFLKLITTSTNEDRFSEFFHR